MNMKVLVLLVLTQLFWANSQAAQTLSDDIEEVILQLHSRVNALEKKCSGKKEVFSVALRPPSIKGYGFGITGPYSTSSVLIHKHVITNIGKGYNTDTGMFTAPVKGVYFFTFTTYSWVGHAFIGASLYRNNEEVLLIWEGQVGGDTEDYASNSAALILNQGDTVYMNLPKGFQVASSLTSNVHTFTGFLLYQL